jgi:hypothetical protein
MTLEGQDFLAHERISSYTGEGRRLLIGRRSTRSIGSRSIGAAGALVRVANESQTVMRVRRNPGRQDRHRNGINLGGKGRRDAAIMN